MHRFFKALSAAFCAASVVVFLFVAVAGSRIPDHIVLDQSDTQNLGGAYGIRLLPDAGKSATADAAEYDVNVRLFNVIPVKSARVSVAQRKYVTVCGTPFGIRLYTDGVIVVKTDFVDTQNGRVNPAKQAGIKEGDVIKKMDGVAVGRNDEVASRLAASHGREIAIELSRNGEVFTVQFRAQYSAAEQKYRAGLWVRDSTAGVGTLTFYVKETGVFAGLGHAVCDVDTGEMMPLLDGDIVNARITGCYKGTGGAPGELCGAFSSEAVGSLMRNGETGVYGRLYMPDANAKTLPVAVKQEVTTGKAQILATVSGSKPQYYDVEIKRAYSSEKANQKNMVIAVTDPRLIEKTGGIVQGMSGSPIIQNGMFVGAVTHVFVNNPLQGYAIFAENMLETAQSLTQNLQDSAA